MRSAYFSKSKNEIVFFGFELNTIEITHWNEAGTDVYPPTMRVKWHPVW